eukprot:Rmarinus@m.26500
MESQDSFCCPICLEYYAPRKNEPLIFVGCGHTVCEHCVVRLRNSGRLKLCPLCRTSLPPRCGVPKNFALLDVIDQIREIQSWDDVLSLRGKFEHVKEEETKFTQRFESFVQQYFDSGSIGNEDDGRPRNCVNLNAPPPTSSQRREASSHSFYLQLIGVVLLAILAVVHLTRFVLDYFVLPLLGSPAGLLWPGSLLLALVFAAGFFGWVLQTNDMQMRRARLETLVGLTTLVIFFCCAYAFTPPAVRWLWATSKYVLQSLGSLIGLGRLIPQPTGDAVIRVDMEMPQITQLLDGGSSPDPLDGVGGRRPSAEAAWAETSVWEWESTLRDSVPDDDTAASGTEFIASSRPLGDADPARGFASPLAPGEAISSPLAPGEANAGLLAPGEVFVSPLAPREAEDAVGGWSPLAHLGSTLSMDEPGVVMKIADDLGLKPLIHYFLRSPESSYGSSKSENNEIDDSDEAQWRWSGSVIAGVVFLALIIIGAEGPDDRGELLCTLAVIASPAYIAWLLFRNLVFPIVTGEISPLPLVVFTTIIVLILLAPGGQMSDRLHMLFGFGFIISHICTGIAFFSFVAQTLVFPLFAFMPGLPIPLIISIAALLLFRPR